MLKIFKLMIFLLMAMLFTAGCKKDGKAEKHASEILDHILGARNLVLFELEKKGIKSSDIIFVTFWDFDGTILHGDCSEGLKEKDDTEYKGLLQYGIEEGLTIYKKNEFNKFWNDYQEMDKTKGHLESYTYLLKIFKGTDVAKIETMAKEKFRDTYHDYFYASSLKMINTLKKENIKVYIISASADFFVKGASQVLGIPSEQINGIRIKINKDNTVSDKIIKPVTYDNGKTERIKEIIRDLKKNKKYVIPIAAFGNSYHTDGHFLKWIANQRIPGGKTISVMINGGKNSESKYSQFKKVSQKSLRRM